ncbi:unnamed protein product, partial [Phaeothamnion confervicola]
LEVGTAVDANYRGKGRHYPGRIARVWLDGSCNIDYDDGEREERANYKGRGRWYGGRVARCHLDGSYDVDYNDGEKEEHVTRSLVRPREGEKSGDRGNGDDGGSGGSTTRHLVAGARVEANYKRRGRYYNGEISRMHGDGSCDIAYDDGERELRVKPALVHLLDDPAGSHGRIGGGGVSRGRSPTRSSTGEDSGTVVTASRRGSALKWEVGHRVEADYKGRKRWYPGTVMRVRAGGTRFDIDYDDGEKEAGVTADRLRRPPRHGDDRRDGGGIGGGGGDGGGGGKLQVDDRIEANYRGEGRFYSGRVTRVRLDGTCDIDYDDGTKEERVRPAFVRRPVRAGDLAVGDRIEANYKGRGRWYGGRVARCRLDGSYDIDYNDGEKEERVARALIRFREGEKSGDRGNGSDGGGGSTTGHLVAGSRVEANYKRRGRYYKGEISRVHGDSSCDIAYDNGERELRVEPALVYLLDDLTARGTDAASSGKLGVGDRIEAGRHNRGRFVPGIVARARLDGTYDVDYDDGQSEERVSRDLIRLRRVSRRDANGGGDRGRSAAKFNVGSRIEADYKGRWCGGVVARCRIDGSYDIDYDDGRREERVATSALRAVANPRPGGRRRGASSGSGSESSRRGGRIRSRPRSRRPLDVGARVEASIAGTKGRSHWRSGVLLADHGDGTFSMRYDDCEVEEDVPAACLRRLSGGLDAGDGDSGDGAR